MLSSQSPSTVVKEDAREVRSLCANGLVTRSAYRSHMPPMRSALYAGRDDTSPGGMSTSSYPESMHSSAKRVVMLGLGSIAGLSLLTALPGRALAAASEEAFIDALATMIEAKAVMAPTERYVFMQAYDAGRSNIQYIINQLQLQKKVNVLIRNRYVICMYVYVYMYMYMCITNYQSTYCASLIVSTSARMGMR
jgi:hypothetical protein